MRRLSNVETFSKDILSGLPDYFYYHNLEHTKSVVATASSIAEELQLSENEIEIILATAWLHDIGHVDSLKNHEEISAKMAADVLSESGYSEEEISAIQEAIKDTDIHRTPSSTYGEVLCDADLHTFGTDEFFSRAIDAYNEVVERGWGFSEEKQELVRGQELSEERFWELRAQLLENHEFHTCVAKERFAAKKQDNLQVLRDALRSGTTASLY